ncbi:p21-C-terminal region-binding protein-domain-containing protein [Fimicolochytrium jonesii]|uniref:p21-C-terminal region-binding protein-domain-containing protein n=1 Tax=Fimicolochytrium jonesii TaxID=1396493 RepID=UPI0022FE74BD|nr:p21-C-terminal region-binding protein-domain-containing protein [Fimicolochytrium jonesii]KAI8816149.1 p21-C-terminal region-binding protein-domain-containing protein [Fimicolochytrium jonesii]
MSKKRKAAAVATTAATVGDAEVENNSADTRSESDHDGEKPHPKKPQNGSDEDDDEDDDNEDLDQETVDVDFEFFDPKPIDFHGLKSLLRQTFHSDTDLIPASQLADLIISRSAVGTTVKVEDTQDPYALMTVVDLGLAAGAAAVVKEDGEKDGTSANPNGKTKGKQPAEDSASFPSAVKAVTDYLLSRARKATTTTPSSTPDAFTRLSTVINPTTTTQPAAAWLLNERLLNMPPQIVPPMLKMLLEEIESAVEEGTSPDFAHFVYVSKIYREVEGMTEEEAAGGDDDGTGRGKKKKRRKEKSASEDAPVFFFQMEDEIIQEHATFTFDYPFAKPAQQSTDSRRAFHEFGIDPLRRVMVIPKEEMRNVLAALEAALGST